MTHSVIFSGLIFLVGVYVFNWKRVHGKWPRVRNPFYNK